MRWGEQTYDEMMVGFFDAAVPVGVSKQHFFIRTKEQQQVGSRDLHQGTGQARLGQVRLCYLQFDYARLRNSAMRKLLC